MTCGMVSTPSSDGEMGTYMMTGLPPLLVLYQPDFIDISPSKQTGFTRDTLSKNYASAM
jgi:hypothetical protein